MQSVFSENKPFLGWHPTGIATLDTAEIKICLIGAVGLGSIFLSSKCATISKVNDITLEFAKKERPHAKST